MTLEKNKKEDKKTPNEKVQADITNMNRLTEDENTTCGITDMNCTDNQETAKEKLDINKLNPGKDDSTCEITDMNCED
ncbi:MAG: hypothetical protein MSC43_04560 [Clostridiales bacterium]|nr:hypothetical protein [Clostridiales bacterium]MDD7432596.1 hypothetical protein [Clostridiales bacterium]MDY3061823.1 hypothetical protein [Eubacteriales bacterium]